MHPVTVESVANIISCIWRPRLGLSSYIFNLYSYVSIRVVYYIMSVVTDIHGFMPYMNQSYAINFNTRIYEGYFQILNDLLVS